MKKVKGTPDWMKKQLQVDNASKKKLGIHLKEAKSVKK